MSIRAMLFDLDNTLYPASSGLMQHVDRRIGQYVQQWLKLPQEEADAIRHHYYTTYGTTLRGLEQHHGHAETDEYLRFVHDIAIEQYLTANAELDAALADLPVTKVIFTNSPHEHAERVLEALGIAHHFERTFDLRYFNFVPKPDPQCYQHILDELGIAGSEALLLEDTAQNLDPAKALGMTTVLISDQPTVYPNADYVVADVLTALELARPLLLPRMTLVTKPAAPARITAEIRRSA